jgi:arginase
MSAADQTLAGALTGRRCGWLATTSRRPPGRPKAYFGAGHACPRGAELLDLLPATIAADRVALVGMHDWTDPTLPPIAADWGLTVFDPDTLRSDSTPLVDWLHRIGATKVGVHFDVDTIDANEIQLGLGADLGGLTSTEAPRVVADIDGVVEVVALTIAEYVPRQVMHLQQILAGFPLLGP